MAIIVVVVFDVVFKICLFEFLAEKFVRQLKRKSNFLNLKVFQSSHEDAHSADIENTELSKLWQKLGQPTGLFDRRSSGCSSERFSPDQIIPQPGRPYPPLSRKPRF